LGGTPQKNFRGQKHAKFSPISAANISQMDEDIQNWIVILSTAILPALGETSLVKFGPVTLEI